MNTSIYLLVLFSQSSHGANHLSSSLLRCSKSLNLDNTFHFVGDKDCVQLPLTFKALDKVATTSQMESAPSVWLKAGFDDDKRLLLTYFLFFTHQVAPADKSKVLKSKVFDSSVVPVICYDNTGSRIAWPWTENGGQEVLAAGSFKFQSGSRDLRTSIDGFRIGLKFDQLFRYLRCSEPSERGLH